MGVIEEIGNETDAPDLRGATIKKELERDGMKVEKITINEEKITGYAGY